MTAQCWARPATIADAQALAPRLRQADLAEIAAHTGHSPLQALEDGVRDSQWSLAVCLSGSDEVIALCGVGHHKDAPDIGVPWMLASDALVAVQTPFLRRSRAVVDLMQRPYRVLANVVDARNQVHIRWLSWCGFRFIRLHPEFGQGRLPFYEFVRIAPCANS